MLLKSIRAGFTAVSIRANLNCNGKILLVGVLENAAAGHGSEAREVLWISLHLIQDKGWQGLRVEQAFAVYDQFFGFSPGGTAIFFGSKPKNLAVADYGSGTENTGSHRQGQPHEDQHVDPLRGLHHGLERGLGPVQDHPVPEEIPAAGAGEGQLGKHQHLDAFFIRLADALDDALRVILAVGHLDDRGRRRDLHKSVFHLLYSFLLQLYSVLGLGKNTGPQGSSTGRVCM